MWLVDKQEPWAPDYMCEVLFTAARDWETAAVQLAHPTTVISAVYQWSSGTSTSPLFLLLSLFRGGDKLGHMLALSLCALPVTVGALCVMTFASTHHKAQKLHSSTLARSAPLYCYLFNARLRCGKCPVVLQRSESSLCQSLVVGGLVFFQPTMCYIDVFSAALCVIVGGSGSLLFLARGLKCLACEVYCRGPRKVKLGISIFFFSPIKRVEILCKGYLS